MARLAHLARRVPALVKAIVGLGALWAIWFNVVHVYSETARALLRFALHAGWVDGLVRSVVSDAIYHSRTILEWALTPLIFGVTLAVPVAMLVRMVARARLRAGLSDPLERVRAWMTSHPQATRAAIAIPALHVFERTARHAALYIARWDGYSTYADLLPTASLHKLQMAYAASMVGFSLLMAAASACIYAATRLGARAFLAPTIDEEEGRESGVSSERRIGFDAVAVTTETRAAVAAMAALPVLAVLFIQAANLRDAGTLAVLATYATVAITGALVFRRASRIAVGVDGIFVTGSSRSRFFPYSALDAVRANGSDIELVGADRVVLRLQLHGKDATEKDSIVERIQAAILAAKQRQTATVGEIVTSVSEDKLVRLVDGAQGYRSPSVTRAQLWSVVEGPEHDGETRTSAARALVASGHDEERADARVRVGVAAARSAEPRVRVALRELADQADQETPEPSALLRQRSR